MSHGTASGAARTATPSPASSTAAATWTARPQGTSFSSAMITANVAIHARFITPSANRPAISPQQQPRHQPPSRAPMPSAPRSPVCQAVRRKASGLRQRLRQASFAGVSSYAAATSSVAPASTRPPCSQSNDPPRSALPSAIAAYASTPAAAQASR